MIDKIEILSTDLLSQNQTLISDLKNLAWSLSIATGWHYHLDWSWILSQLGDVKGKRILDAGAGLGVLQWYLAEQGAEVISVDRSNRACVPFHLRKRYDVRGLRPTDLLTSFQMLNPFYPAVTPMDRVKGLYRSAAGMRRKQKAGRAPGIIYIYNQDLGKMVHIADNSVDAIISVSALEHNQPANLPMVVKELERVLKPGSGMFVTLAAGRDQDWFHQPSEGWCYTDTTLKQIFNLSSTAPSNYDQYDALFAALKSSQELRDHLAPVYRRTAKLGMPKGVWDPQYQPVGVVKVKEEKL